MPQTGAATARTKENVEIDDENEPLSGGLLAPHRRPQLLEGNAPDDCVLEPRSRGGEGRISPNGDIPPW